MDPIEQLTSGDFIIVLFATFSLSGNLRHTTHIRVGRDLIAPKPPREDPAWVVPIQEVFSYAFFPIWLHPTSSGDRCDRFLVSVQFGVPDRLKGMRGRWKSCGRVLEFYRFRRQTPSSTTLSRLFRRGLRLQTAYHHDLCVIITHYVLPYTHQNVV